MEHFQFLLSYAVWIVLFSWQARQAVGAWLDAITVNKKANGLARVVYVLFFCEYAYGIFILLLKVIVICLYSLLYLLCEKVLDGCHGVCSLRNIW